MEDNSFKTNASQPLPGEEGVSSLSPLPIEEQSTMKSFLSRFGLGKNKDQVVIPQPNIQSTPLPPPSDASDFSSRLDEVGSQPAGTNPVDTAPSMDGADVVREPSPMASDPAAQPQIPSQEPRGSPNLDVNVGEVREVSNDVQKPAADISPPPVTAETPSPVGTTPDLIGTSINSPLQDALSRPVGTINNISSPEDIASRESALPDDVRNTLKSVGQNLNEAQEALNKVLGSSSSDAAADMPAAPKEPAGITS